MFPCPFGSFPDYYVHCNLSTAINVQIYTIKNAPNNVVYNLEKIMFQLEYVLAAFLAIALIIINSQAVSQYSLKIIILYYLTNFVSTKKSKLSLARF